MEALAFEQEIGIDDSRWPIVVVTPPRRVTDDQMRTHLATFAELQRDRGGPHILVLDLRRCEKISPRQREMIAERMPTATDHRACLGLAMVFTSTLTRGILTAIFWLRRPPYPTKIFSELAPALDWAQRTLHAETQTPDRSEGLTAAPATESPNPANDLGWRLQGPGTRDRKHAEDLVETLRNEGLDPHIESASVAGQTLFVVIVGNYATREHALDIRDLVDRLGVGVALLRGDDPVY